MDVLNEAYYKYAKSQYKIFCIMGYRYIIKICMLFFEFFETFKYSF